MLFGIVLQTPQFVSRRATQLYSDHKLRFVPLAGWCVNRVFASPLLPKCLTGLLHHCRCPLATRKRLRSPFIVGVPAWFTPSSGLPSKIWNRAGFELR